MPPRSWPAGLTRVRDAAGLLLVFPSGGRAHIVLTVRAETLGRHSGQVSLPGGVIEPGEAFEEAALREAHEEIALAIIAEVVNAHRGPRGAPPSNDVLDHQRPSSLAVPK